MLLMKNQDYSESMTVPVENVVSTFLQGSACADMMSFVEAVRRNEDVNASARRKAIADNMPYNDGLCGEQIKNDIIENLREKPSLLRVVLYGTGEICRYYLNGQQWNQTTRFHLLALADSNADKWGEGFLRSQSYIIGATETTGVRRGGHHDLI